MDYMNMATLRFLLYNVHGLQDILTQERFQEFDTETVDIFLNAVKQFADTEAWPYFREMDEKPVEYKDGKVIVHPQIEKIIQQSAELGMIGGTFDFEDGGMQMPESVMTAGYFIVDSSNNNVSGYPGLTGGAAELIASFGSQELKDTYIPRMMSGEWGGTMCLTEPHAGSSLSDIITSAAPTEEGYYHIKGQKIWISGGDHQYSDSFIHLLLARIEGAPAGTKGISLFVVPSRRLTADGSLESNDMMVAADFQKLGQRGYATTHLVFGDNGDCRGWLVGEANQGLRYMFQMMNGARISVGRHGAAIATAAYYQSLKYAHERPQGRRLATGGKKDLTEGQTLIINHPDVRRMLLLQKAVSEGALSLVLQAAIYHDWEKSSEGEEKERNHMLLELLTPIVKTYPAEMGRFSVSTGLQVLGGMGFSSETILQQYYRDIRIMAIYEGTTGIQSLDLLGRKMMMHGGKSWKLLMEEMGKTIADAQEFDGLKPHGSDLNEKIQLVNQVLGFLVPFAQKGDHERFLSDATLFMELLGNIVVAWQWLIMGVQAQRALVAENREQTEEFYKSKLHTLEFYYKYELPKTLGLAQSLTDDRVLTIIEEQELII